MRLGSNPVSLCWGTVREKWFPVEVQEVVSLSGRDSGSVQKGFWAFKTCAEAGRSDFLWDWWSRMRATEFFPS